MNKEVNNNNNNNSSVRSGWIKGAQEFREVFHYLETVLESVKIRCMCNNHIFESTDLRHTKIENEYWIFAHCKKCKYDYNYLKIFRQYNAILADQSNNVNDIRTTLDAANKIKDRWNAEDLI